MPGYGQVSGGLAVRSCAGCLLHLQRPSTSHRRPTYEFRRLSRYVTWPALRMTEHWALTSAAPAPGSAPPSVSVPSPERHVVVRRTQDRGDTRQGPRAGGKDRGRGVPAGASFSGSSQSLNRGPIAQLSTPNRCGAQLSECGTPAPLPLPTNTFFS